MLLQLLTDSALLPTADYEAALLASVPVNPLPRVERLAGRCLFRLIEKERGSEGGMVLPVVARAMATPMVELLSNMLRNDVPMLPVDGQAQVLEAVAAWADGFMPHAEARRYSAAALIRAWAGDEAEAASLIEVEAGLAADGVTQRGARALFELAVGSSASPARTSNEHILSTLGNERPKDENFPDNIENAVGASERYASGNGSGADVDYDQHMPEERVSAEALAMVLGSYSEWAFLAQLDQRTSVLCRIARRLVFRELLDNYDAEGDAALHNLWDGDVLGVLAEILKMNRSDFVQEVGRLLSLETLRLACCSVSNSSGGGRRRLALLRSMAVAVSAERMPLHAWRTAVQNARRARQMELDAAAAQAQAITKPSNAQMEAENSVLGVYEGDEARPLPLKSCLQQVVTLYQAKAIADSKNDLLGRPREAAPTFLSGQLIRQYGLRSIAVKNLRNLAAGVRKEATANQRIALFGRAVGMLDPQGYHEGLCDLVCDAPPQLG